MNVVFYSGLRSFRINNFGVGFCCVMRKSTVAKLAFFSALVIIKHHALI